MFFERGGGEIPSMESYLKDTTPVEPEPQTQTEGSGAEGKEPPTADIAAAAEGESTEE